FDVDLDFVAHEHAAGLERLVPLEAPLAAADRALRAETEAIVAPRILAGARLLDVEDDLVRLIANREIARDFVVAARAFDLLALEDHLREFLRVEEVGRAQVAVALVLARVDARGVDLDL